MTMFDNNRSIDGLQQKQCKGRYWMLDIGGQLCIGMCVITTNLVMHVKEQEDW
jgi:hypothetical protein